MKSNAVEKIGNREGVFAIVETNRGEIVIELFYKKTPLTVTNFVALAEGKMDAAKGKPFYDGLKFHRVISVANGDDQDFMIQGGDPRGNGTGGPGYQFPDEFVDDLKFDSAGLLAMANSGPGTNGSQFFITIAQTPWLTGHHTIFGRVVDGQKVVNATLQGDVIKSIKIVRNGAEAKKFSATQADFDALVAKAQSKAEEESRAAAEKIKAQFADFTWRDDGMAFKILKEGAGEKVGKSKHVAVHYEGRLTSGEVFDSSIPRGQPLDFDTGAGQMIPGFDIMTQDMKVGEKRAMILPPEFAYGNRAMGPIKANSTLIFEVELLSAK